MKNLILAIIASFALFCIANTTNAQGFDPLAGLIDSTDIGNQGSQVPGSQIPSSEDPSVDGDFRTQTIGGWGSEPRGNNPGKFLHTNFDAVFTDGITIGSGENTLVFTSAQAITDFLPATGTSQSLKSTFIDPTKSDIRNTFASQTLALTISVGFDKAIETFSSTSISLGDMVIAEGELAGESVKAVLGMANKALAGEETEYSISTLNGVISSINENYVDGSIDNGYLTVDSKTAIIGKF